MTKKFALIVTDASPLITLAIADALDLLLLPTLPVVIPDMVRYEVARNLAKPGAQQITSWIRDNEPTRVRVATTEVFDEFQIILNSKPDARSSNRGNWRLPRSWRKNYAAARTSEFSCSRTAMYGRTISSSVSPITS